MLTLVFCLGLPVTASANGLEPPDLTILVTHPPKDLELTLVLEDDAFQEPFVLQPEPMLWESYYRFYPHIWSPWAPEGTSLQTATLFVKTGGESFSLAVEPKGFTYSNNLVTLDIAGRQLLYGQPWVAHSPAGLFAGGIDPPAGGGALLAVWLPAAPQLAGVPPGELGHPRGGECVRPPADPGGCQRLQHPGAGDVPLHPPGNRCAAGRDAGLCPAAEGTPETPGCGLRCTGQSAQLGLGRDTAVPARPYNTAY